MSLDGFIAPGPDDSMDWVFAFGKATSLADETMNRIGAILAGPTLVRRQRRVARAVAAPAGDPARRDPGADRDPSAPERFQFAVATLPKTE
jgi:hypothetical protein